MTIPQTNTAFILGAGFSKDVEDFPALDALSALLKDRVEKLEPSLKSFLLETIPQTLWNDFESLLTYLYTSLPWVNVKDHHLKFASFHQLSELLTDILKDSSAGQLKNEDLKLLISYWQETLSPVVTFNYDTLIEQYTEKYIGPRFPNSGTSSTSGDQRCAIRIDRYFFRNLPKTTFEFSENGNHTEIVLHVERGYHQTENLAAQMGDWQKRIRHDLNKLKAETSLREASLGSIDQYILGRVYQTKHMYRLPLHPRDAGQTFPDPSTLVFSYYKLHGSINWLYSGLHEIADEPIYFSSHIVNKTGLVPVIIPPVLDKNHFYKNHTLKMQWTNTFTALKDPNIDTYYFIGYSIPPTDMIAKYLFQDTLNNSQKEKTIYIVNFFTDEKQKHQLLYNYLTSLTGYSSRQALQAIESLKPADTKIHVASSNTTIDWSLCCSEGSTVAVLVEHLLKQKDKTKHI